MTSRIHPLSAAILLVAGIASADVTDLPGKLEKLEARWADAMRQVDLPGFSVAIATADGVIYA
jgi:hypothetical protein